MTSAPQNRTLSRPLITLTAGLVGLVVLAGLVILTIEYPIATVVLLLAGVAVGVSLKLGVLPTVTAAALALLGIAGAAARIAPAAGVLTEFGVLALLALGASGLFRVRVPALVAIAGVTFLLAGSVSAVVVAQEAPEFAFRGWVGVVGAVLATLAVASACISKGVVNPRARALVLTVVIGISTVNVLFALRQALFGLSQQEIESAQTAVSTYLVGDQIRLMGLFATNQDFGLFGACVAPALLVLGISALPRRRWLLLIAGMAYFAIVLSLTRTALIAAFATGMLALVLWGRGRFIGRASRTLLVVGIVGTVGLAIASSIQNARVQDALDRAFTLFNLGGDTSFLARTTDTLPRAFDAFFANPWGSGVGAAGPVSQAFPTLAPFGALTTDNGYLLIAVQTGFIGLAAFMAMLVAVAIWLARSSSPYARAGSAAVIALLAAMFFAQYWGLLAPVSFAAAFVGMGIASRDAVSPSPRT